MVKKRNMLTRQIKNELIDRERGSERGRERENERQRVTERERMEKT